MKRQITLKEAVGKALTGTVSSCNGRMLLIFGDEFCCLRINYGYEQGEGDIESDEAFDLLDFGDRYLVEAGIIGAEALKDLHDKQAAMTKKRREAAEYAYFEQLRQKYG